MDEKMANDGWVVHNGKKLPPITNKTILEIEYRYGDKVKSDGWNFRVLWEHMDDGCDIIAYRVIKDGNNAE